MFPSIQLLQAAVTKEPFKFLRFIPAGRGDLSVQRTQSTNAWYIEVTVRLRNLVGQVILGDSTGGYRTLRVVTSTAISIELDTGNTYTINLSSPLSTDTWYNIVVRRPTTTVNVEVYDLDGELVSSGFLGSVPSDDLVFRSIASYGLTTYDMDIALLKIGAIVDTDRHVWLPQDSGTVWIDTGTDGTWDWNLSGVPLPTWESE